MTTTHAPTLPTIAPMPLQVEFQPVVDELCRALERILGDAIDSLYLYGSVARGTATVGSSDLDLCLITRHPLSIVQTEQLADLCTTTAARHFSVSKVDIDCGTRAEVLAEKNHHSWGYWLKHHCRCIKGDDLGEHFPLFSPSRDIAIAVNGDYLAVLQGYRQRLQETAPESHIRRLQKEASRKLIRATNILRPVSADYWPNTLEEYVSFAIEHHPSSAEFLPFFLQHAYTPTSGVAEFCAQLETAMQWMQQHTR